MLKAKKILKKINEVVTYIMFVTLGYLIGTFFYKGYIAEGFLCISIISIYYIKQEWNRDKENLERLEKIETSALIKELELNSLKARIASSKIIEKSQDILIKQLEQEIKDLKKDN